MVTQYEKYRNYVKVFGVSSSRNPDKEYTVAVTEKNVWSCSCPAWIFHTPRRDCKHITQAKKFSPVKAAKPITPKMEKALDRFSLIEV